MAWPGMMRHQPCGKVRFVSVFAEFQQWHIAEINNTFFFNLTRNIQ